MVDYDVEVTEESWFSRLGNAIAGVAIGFILFLAAFPLLFWNEGRAVKTARSLTEASGLVVSLGDAKVSPGNNNKLVHLKGKATPKGALVDPVFQIKVDGLLLSRTVEMFQWKQTKSERKEKKLGGGTRTITVYKYSRGWDYGRNDSSKFNTEEGHVNPPLQYKAWSARAAQVNVGGFKLSNDLASQLSSSKPLMINEAVKKQIPPSLLAKAKFVGNTLHTGDPAAPRVGDLKISWKWLPASQVSVVAKQVGTQLTKYTTSNGRTVGLVRLGEHSAQAMIQKAQEDNKTITWILRGLGVFLMILGLFLVLNPLAVLADVLPFLGNIVGAGVFLVAFLTGIGFSSATIALGWVAYRPLVGIPLFVLAIASFVLLFGRLRNSGGRHELDEAYG